MTQDEKAIRLEQFLDQPNLTQKELDAAQNAIDHLVKVNPKGDVLSKHKKADELSIKIAILLAAMTPSAAPLPEIVRTGKKWAPPQAGDVKQTQSDLFAKIQAKNRNTAGEAEAAVKRVIFDSSLVQAAEGVRKTLSLPTNKKVFARF